MSDYKWVRFGTPTDYITGGNAPADLPFLEDIPTTFDDVILRDFRYKVHSVLAKQPFWQKFLEAITSEFQQIVHHALFLKHIFNNNIYLGEESMFDTKIQNMYITLGFPFSTSFGDYINAEDPDFKSPDASKEKQFFNRKIFWKQFTIENIVFLRKWLGSLYGYRQIFSSIFRRGGIFLTFKYETSQFSELSGHRFRLFDFNSFDRILPPGVGGGDNTTWPDTTTIDGIIDYSFVTQFPYQFDSRYSFDGKFDPEVPGSEEDTIIAWDFGITASNSNKGLALEITCDRLLYHYNTLYNPADDNPILYCLMDLPWVEYILNLSQTIKRATDKINVGSQLTLIGDYSNTITPYTGSGDDERLYYTHPNIRTKFQIIKSKYTTGSVPTLIRIGTGAYKNWDTGSDPDEFFLRRDQLVAGEPPAAWESEWGANNDIMEDGDCELNLPETTGQSYGLDWIDATLSTDQAHSGTKSLKLNFQPATPGDIGQYHLGNTNPLGGATPGKEYTLGAWVYIPSTGGVLASEFQLQIKYYDSVYITVEQTALEIYDTWQYVEISKFKLPLTATYFDPMLVILDTASLGEIAYVDDIVLYESYNDIKNPVFEMSIGQYERRIAGIWDFTHTMLPAAMFKEELMSSVTLKMNKSPGYFYLTITNGATSNGNITILLGILSTNISVTPEYEEQSFTVTGEPTADGNVIIDGEAIAILDTDTINEVATKIRAHSFTNWTTSGADIGITLTAKTYGDKDLITVDADTTGTTFSSVAKTVSPKNIVAETIRQTIFDGWDVKGSENLIIFFPHITDTYNEATTVFTDTGITGVTATCTETPDVEITTIQLPHNYIAPGSVKLRIEFSESAFNTTPGNDFPVPDEITHTLLIKEIRQNNQWETAHFIRSNYYSYKDNDANTILDYYNGYKDIVENDSVYYDTSAVDDNGDFLPSYFKTQETVAFNLQEVDTGIEITIDHSTGEVIIAPQIILNAFQIAKDSNLHYDGTGDRYISMDVNIYASYNIRASETLRRTAVLGITEVGLFNESGNMIAYGTFPPIIYDSLRHHASFNFFITREIFDSISI